MSFPPLSKHLDCVHFEQCSGCFINKFVESTPVYNDAKMFFEQQGLQLPCLVGNVWGWRHRAKLAVRGSAHKPQMGLFKANTHDVYSIPHCRVHHPKINESVRVIEEWIVEEKILPYEEERHSGELRYLQFAVESNTGRVQLTFVCNFSTKTEKWKRAAQKLWESHPNFWHSIWLNYNVRPDNVIFGEKWDLVVGDPFLWEIFEGVAVCYHPASFAQANREMFGKMISRLKDKVSLNAKVTEFYAGVGVIGLAISDKCEWVRCCEINQQAKECFEMARQKLPSGRGDKLSFLTQQAAKATELIKEADTIIVDPPRKGIDKSLLEVLQKTEESEKLIYVSCGWEAFQRDVKALISHGWTLKEGEAYLFFPGSNHIELLAVLDKS